MLKPLKLLFFSPTLAKMGSPWVTPPPKFFFSEITKPDPKSFQNLFVLTKYMFWLSYECFSILCDAFLLKCVISSHNSCEESSWPIKVTLLLPIKVTPFHSTFRLQSINCAVRVSCLPQFRIKKPDILGAEKWDFDHCRCVVIRTDTFFFQADPL